MQLKMTQWTVGFFDHATNIRLSRSSTHSYAVELTFIENNCIIFDFPTLADSSLLAFESQIPGQLTYEELTRVVLLSIWRDGLASIQLTSKAAIVSEACVN